MTSISPIPVKLATPIPSTAVTQALASSNKNSVSSSQRSVIFVPDVTPPSRDQINHGHHDEHAPIDDRSQTPGAHSTPFPSAVVTHAPPIAAIATMPFKTAVWYSSIRTQNSQNHNETFSPLLQHVLILMYLCHHHSPLQYLCFEPYTNQAEKKHTMASMRPAPPGDLFSLSDDPVSRVPVDRSNRWYWLRKG